MESLPMKKTAKFTYPTNTKLTPDTGEALELLDKSGVDVGELKRQAITGAVLKAVRKLNKIAG
jgi:hypothetical protein